MWFTTDEVATSTGTLSLLYSVKGLQSSYCTLLHSDSIPSLLFFLELLAQSGQSAHSLSLEHYTSLYDMQDKKLSREQCIDCFPPTISTS